MISKIFIFLAVFETTNIKSKLGETHPLNVKRSNQENTEEESQADIVDIGLASFIWCGPKCMTVQFPDGNTDRITLTNVYPEDDSNPCVFEGNFHKDSSASVTVSGCQNDQNVYITIYSRHLENRNMFTINEGIIEELANPYETDDGDDYLEDDSDREKRDVHIDSEYSVDEYKDYIEEDYDQYDYDGSVDFTPPPSLILNIRLSYEETMKAELGSELASQSYIKSVLAHTRNHLKHSTLGTRIELNLIGSIEFVPNTYFTPTSQHMQEAKLIKKDEPFPTIFFCHTDDTNKNTGIAITRKGCDAQKALAIVKHRKDVNMAAITMSHEIGHLIGQKHDSREDKPDGSNGTCSGTGIMSSRVEPDKRPAKWSFCSAYRFSRWFNRTGHACLREPGGKAGKLVPTKAPETTRDLPTSTESQGESGAIQCDSNGCSTRGKEKATLQSSTSRC